jgi:hypothetical protein
VSSFWGSLHVVDDLQATLTKKNVPIYLFRTCDKEVDPEKLEVRLSPMEDLGWSAIEPVRGDCDYGMILSVPNPWDGVSRALIVGGCHRYAQIGLEQWITKPSNLADLLSKYPDLNFQLILEQKYSLSPDGAWSLGPATVIRQLKIRQEALL